jgi:hypothetical protein
MSGLNNLNDNIDTFEEYEAVLDSCADYQTKPINTLKKYVEKLYDKIELVDDLTHNIFGNLEEIRNDIKKRGDNFSILIKEIETHIRHLEKEKVKEKNPVECKTIPDMIKVIDNQDQVTILNRIVTDKEYSKIYLSGYEPNTDTSAKKKDIIGTVKVFGTFNQKKQTREEYEIKIFKENTKGMFWCSCADHKFNSAKKNIVCKHICFIICKIAKVLKPEVFQNKKLSDEDLALLLAKLSSNEGIWQDQDIAKIFKKITLETFKQFIKAIEDCCPVCFNDLTEADKPNLLACPSCKNYIHAECADIWMEQKNTCVLCKSKFWENYPKVKNGGSVACQ